jgi:flagellar biosynthetic protein FlhB
VAEQSGQERTEQATPKRLEEARKRGQIPRSRELNTAAVMLAGGAGLYAFSGSMGSNFAGLMRGGLTISRDQALDSTLLFSTLSNATLKGMMAVAPVLGTIMLAALLAPLALGGWAFSTEALMPNFSRLNPIEGVQRLFSMRGVVELMKALAKFAVVAIIAIWVLLKYSGEMLSLGSEPVESAIGHAIRICGQGLLAMSGGLVLIAGIDVPYQLWQYGKELRMTREEIREEHKENEGSPEIKGKIRQIQQQMASRRMMEKVPTADVVVTNPTHFAVALKYDDNRMRAPIVVAKGADAVAARIREIATENGVALFEAPPLARAIYKSVDLDQEIPTRLYVAVAQVLGYVFQLKSVRLNGGERPVKPVVEVDENEGSAK